MMHLHWHEIGGQHQLWFGANKIGVVYAVDARRSKTGKPRPAYVARPQIKRDQPVWPSLAEAKRAVLRYVLASFLIESTKFTGSGHRVKRARKRP